MKRFTIILLIGSLSLMYSCCYCPAFPTGEALYIPDKYVRKTMKYISSDGNESVVFQCSSIKSSDTKTYFTNSCPKSCSSKLTQNLTDRESYIEFTNRGLGFPSDIHGNTGYGTLCTLEVKISAFGSKAHFKYDPYYDSSKILPEWTSLNGRHYTDVLNWSNPDLRVSVYLAHGYGIVQIEVGDKIYYLE